MVKFSRTSALTACCILSTCTFGASLAFSSFPLQPSLTRQKHTYFYLKSSRMERTMIFAKQLSAAEEAELADIRAKLTSIFKTYDKNKDGHLTQDEYNAWCKDTKRSIRSINNPMRFEAFCKRIGSDPSKGLSLDGLVKLYASAEQLGKKGSPALAGSFALIVSALLVCILLSIPYYLPSCTGDLCRTSFP